MSDFRRDENRKNHHYGDKMQIRSPFQPRYDLEKLKNLIRSGAWGYLNTDRIDRTLDDLGWTDQNVALLICALSPERTVNGGDFVKVTDNCKIAHLAGVPTVDADQYRIFWDEAAGKRMETYAVGSSSEFFVKIAVVEDDQGELTGVVSFHLSGQP